MVDYNVKKRRATSKRSGSKGPRTSERAVSKPSTKRSVEVPKTPRARQAHVTKAEALIRSAARRAQRALQTARKKKTKAAYDAARAVRAEADKATKKARAEIRRIERAVAQEKKARADARETKKKQKASEKKVRSQVSRVTEAEQRARGKKRTPKTKKEIRAEERRIEKERLEAALKTQKLPQRTPDERRKAIRTVRQQMLEDFKRLQDHARVTGQLPSRDKTGRFESYENIGEQRWVKVERVLDDRSLEAILYKAREASKLLPGDKPLWYAKLVFSGMGERLFASGKKMLDTSKLDDPGEYAKFFQVQGFDNTGLWNQRQSMLVALEGLLENYAATPNTIIFLHGILIKNFKRKAPRR